MKMFVISFIMLLLAVGSEADESQKIRFGVFDYLGYEETRAEYEPLVKHLSKRLQTTVELYILSHEEMIEKVAKNELDIITTNPSHFLYFRQKYDLSGALATLLVEYEGKVLSELSGVILVRSNSPIKRLQELKEKTIIASSDTRLGGFYAQAYELHKSGIDIKKEAKNIIQTYGPHQEIVKKLLSDESIDVAFVRCGVLEMMIESKELHYDEIRIINQREHRDYPFISSTSLYPQWPVFAMPYVDRELLERFVAALYLINADSSFVTNSQLYGYTIPADYLKTEELAKALRLPPFEAYGQIDIREILKKYKLIFSIIVLLFILIVILYIKSLKGTREIASLVDNMGDGVYGVDKNGLCTWINPKALELLGFDKKDILYKDQHELFHHHTLNGDPYKHCDCPIHKTIEDKIRREAQEYFIRKDGTFFPVSLTVAPVKNRSGAIVIFRDISKMQEDHLKLQENEKLLVDFFENSTALIAIKALDGKYLMVNKIWESVAKLTREEVLGKTDFDLFSQEIAEQFVKNDREAIEENRVIETEEYIVDNDKKRYFISTKFPLLGVDKELKGLCAIIIEITRVKEAEEEVVLNNKRFNALLDSMKELMFIKDSKLRYIVTNRALEEFFGLSKEELYYKSDKDLMGEDLGAECIASDKEVIKNGALVVTQEKMGERIYETHKFPVDLGEQGIGIGSFITDITENKRALNALVEAKKVAEEANQAKSQFLANMSHEIRTPMNAVIGLGELLEEMNLGAKEKDILHKMNSSSKILLKILNDILDYSKIEAGRLELESKCFEIQNIISQLELMFSQNAQERGLGLRFELDSDLPQQVFGDEFRLEQVLINLCSNAIKFTTKGDILVSLKLLESYDDGHVLLEWSVSDKGIGISENKLEKLFKAFVQADSSTTRQYGGTGLGLVICKNILEAMDAALHVKSKEGEGSIFSFELRMKICQDEVKLAYDKQTKQIEENSKDALAGVNVLVVEDSEINQEVVTMMLESYNIGVDIANNGAEGIEMFFASAGKYDAILMDLQMPIMGGYEACAKIRESNKEIPIIALTAAVMVEDRARVLEAGMNDHLAKPIDKEKLYSLLQKHIVEQKHEDNSEFNQVIQEMQTQLKEATFMEQEYLQNFYQKVQPFVKEDALKAFIEAVEEFEFVKALEVMQGWES